MSYSDNELLECILDCIDESLPNSWEYSILKLKVDNDNLNAQFAFKDMNSDSINEFAPNNSMAPITSAYELYRNLLNDGDKGNTIMIKIFQEGRYDIGII
ncbi:hypothetical protein MD588_07970 [Photobacterium sp. SDRW27]|uniref:hypothetical protein n=1 Tax=Photobacterium obscurum TaxID=2829490 RepID=UPI002243B0AF|nr:hypothetical protein [Photobacterium obscurum]MCW8328744.1 hypothetical protein [Photobacterium obscurum]